MEGKRVCDPKQEREARVRRKKRKEEEKEYMEKKTRRVSELHGTSQVTYGLSARG